MGSGCNQTTNNTGSRCIQVVSDQCVVYTGDPIESLGVCTGDRLSEIETIILTKLLDHMESLDLSAIDLNCAFISDQMIGEEKDLFTLLQVLIDSNCTLKGLVQTLDDSINTSVSFDLKCVTQTTPDIPGTIQGLINKVCSLQTQVDNIVDQLNDEGDISTTVVEIAGNTILSAINTCDGSGLTKTGSGATANILISGLIPAYCPIPCFAPLSNFDSTGAGFSNSAFCGWQICNGNGGSPDMRGYAFAGATALPGIFASNPLNGAVDPAIVGLPYGSSIGDKKGTVKEALSISQMPSHSHPIIQTPHTHTVTVHTPTGTSPGGLPAIAGADSVSALQNTITTSSSSANVTLQAIGESQAHNNVQPTIYGYWIMRLS